MPEIARLARPEFALAVGLALTATVAALALAVRVDRRASRRGLRLAARLHHAIIGRYHADLAWRLALVTAVAASILGSIRACMDTSSTSEAFALLWRMDATAATGGWLIPLGLAATLLLMTGHEIARARPISLAWMLLTALAACSAIAAADLLVLFVSLEILALADYALARSTVRGAVRRAAFERRFQWGAAASLAVLVGAALLAFLAGGTNLDSLQAYGDGMTPFAATAAVALLLLGALGKTVLAVMGPLSEETGDLRRRWASLAFTFLVPMTVPPAAAFRVLSAMPFECARPVAFPLALVGFVATFWMLARLSRASGPRGAAAPLILGQWGLSVAMLATACFHADGEINTMLATLLVGQASIATAWMAGVVLFGRHHGRADAAAHWATMQGLGRCPDAVRGLLTVAWGMAMLSAVGAPPTIAFAGRWPLSASLVRLEPTSIAASLVLVAAVAWFAIWAMRLLGRMFAMPLAPLPLCDEPLQRRRACAVLLLAMLLAIAPWRWFA